ncbi:hypothetical protein AT15_08395 [Kosmotoga arenicorallina S304]|uniref:SLH domain-containing protein n=1 Tax=Kosmotoga arenicorallina S304 TaxID=1453497 RepID=A0A176K1G6_9BACT|nr:hypothetical protein [Kosmotoga arenicorallina]OAA30988.1 hypothetical protein AT15_08395 [Kosmotoga arenicorallina S304]
MKKNLILLIVLAVAGIGFAFYTDISADNPYYAAIQRAVNSGIFTAVYDDAEKFEGITPVTRFEMAVMINKLLDYTDESKIPLVTELNKIALDLEAMEKHFSEFSNKAELSLRVAQEMEENFTRFLEKYDLRVNEVDKHLSELSMKLDEIETAVKTIEENINGISLVINSHEEKIEKLESELKEANLSEMKDTVKTNTSELNRLSKDIDSISSQMRIYMISLLLIGVLATIGIFIK